MTTTPVNPQTDLDGPVATDGPPPPPPPPSSDGVPHAKLRLAALVAALVAVGVLWPWVLVVIGALVLMITLHEWGHYYTAKRAGMKVTEFFLFFGPKVWSIRRGETEYGIKCIPLGAYVKIIGMSNIEQDIPPEDEPRTYRQKPFMSRISVAVAGSTMHFILATVLIFVALTMVGTPGGTLDMRKQAYDWRIGTIVDGTGAEAAGLQPGDHIVSIDGTDVPTYSDLRSVTEPLRGKTVPVVYQRDGQTRTVDLTLKPFYSWYVDRTVDGTGPAEAGLQPGDAITEIGGVSLRHDSDPDAVLRRFEGQTVPVTFERTNAEGVDVSQTKDVEISSLILAGTRGYVGISEQEPPDVRLGLLEGLKRTPQDFASVMWSSVQGMGQLFSPSGLKSYFSQVGSAQADRQAAAERRRQAEAPSSDESSARLLERGGSLSASSSRPTSIVGIVQVGNQVGHIDPGALIALFALINIFIGMFNLVPLLPLDGGHVAIACYERIQELRLRRRRYFVDMSRLMPLTMVVIGILAVLALTSIYLDIANPLVSQ